MAPPARLGRSFPRDGTADFLEGREPFAAFHPFMHPSVWKMNAANFACSEFSEVASVVVSHHTGSRTQRPRTRRRRHSREVGQPDLHTGGGHPGSSRPSVAFAAPLGQSHIFAEPHNSTVACLSLGLCTAMPSRRILGTSPVGNSANFACWMFSESA